MDDLLHTLAPLSLPASGVVLVLLGVGLSFRRRPRVHIPIMATCFVADVLNVLVVELSRHAIARTVETAARPGEWILKLHIIVSVASMVCYVIAVASGIRLLKTGKGRTLHRRNAAVFVVTRVLNFATSFFVA